MERADAGFLLGKESAVPLCELVEELVAAVGDRGREVSSVHYLKGQDRLFMASVKALQLRHFQTLSTWPAGPRATGTAHRSLYGRTG